jgi:hypothetical protein
LWLAREEQTKPIDRALTDHAEETCDEGVGFAGLAADAEVGAWPIEDARRGAMMRRSYEVGEARGATPPRGRRYDVDGRGLLDRSGTGWTDRVDHPRAATEVADELGELLRVAAVPAPVTASTTPASSAASGRWEPTM